MKKWLSGLSLEVRVALLLIAAILFLVSFVCALSDGTSQGQGLACLNRGATWSCQHQGSDTTETSPGVWTNSPRTVCWCH